jgi:hypothetical protein
MLYLVLILSVLLDRSVNDPALWPSGSKSLSPLSPLSEKERHAEYTCHVRRIYWYGFHLLDWQGGGSILVNEGLLELDGCTFEDTTAVIYGCPPLHMTR